MEGDRELAALARIEAALTRIAAAPTSAATTNPDLERRHAELRASVEASIAELDGVIAGLSK